MKIFKNKLHLSVLSRGKLILPMVLAFAFWCINTEVEAQTYSELDATSQEAVKIAFEAEIDRIKDELHNPTQGIDLSSHRNVLQYYRVSMQFFRKGGEISLRDAFVKNLILLQKSPVEGHPVALAVFTGNIETRFLYLGSIPYVVMNQGLSLQTSTEGENVGEVPAPITSEFEQVLVNLVIDGSDISPLENLFEFIRSKK